MIECGMKKYREYYHIKNEIFMLKKGYKGSFLIVEGPSDARLFKKFINKKKCLVIPACGKKNIHLLIQKEKFGDREDILFIRDLDCSKVNNNQKMAENIFFTDNRDRECDIIRSNDFDNYLESENFFEECNIEIDVFKDILLQECKLIGLLRCYSEKNNLSLPFKKVLETDIDFNDILNDEISIDFEKFLTKLKNNIIIDYDMSAEAKEKLVKILNDIPTLKTELEKIEAVSKDLWSVCNGHDLTKFLFLFLLKKYHFKAFNKISWKKFEDEKLLDIYSAGEFAKTNLYQQIRNWEEKHKPWCFLKE